MRANEGLTSSIAWRLSSIFAVGIALVRMVLQMFRQGANSADVRSGVRGGESEATGKAKVKTLLSRVQTMLKKEVEKVARLAHRARPAPTVADTNRR